MLVTSLLGIKFYNLRDFIVVHICGFNLCLVKEYQDISVDILS